MNGRRIGIGAAIGAVLGAGWWGGWRLIASGQVCTKDNWQCLGLGLLWVPVGMVLGGLAAWAALRALEVARPVLAAVVGVLISAALTALTIWVPLPAAPIVTAALGFAIAAAVTAGTPVSHTAARD
jgi:hypothetical protein